ncbi:MAG: ATP-binding cassette domain-containing protein [Planctomycetota bacterium]
MLLEAQDLTRYYGDLLAVDHVSFSVDRGQIVGLLGPNGAGKSTIIRMLTGFLPTSSGAASIAGFDVREEPLQARRHVGYMPESNPLYPEMRTREFLRFRAELKGVARRRRNRRIGQCLEMCRIRDVADQVIGTLSKGYRQRVGLADALLAEPDVLILDEPTIGLDPNQVRDTRGLISSLSERHTVLISTHILAEAEAICQRALIIDRGRLVADDTLHALSDRLLRSVVTVEVRGDDRRIVQRLERLPGVSHVHPEREAGEWKRFAVAGPPEADIRPAIFRAAVENGWELRELTRREGSLEEVFQRMTRRQEPPAEDAATPAAEEPS